MTLLFPLLLGCSDYKLHGDPADSGVPEVACEELEPDPASVAIDESCVFEPEPGSFSPVVEWQWTVDAGAPGYDDVMMTPAVGDLDGDGVPEIVVTAYAGTGYGSAGALVVIAGDGSGEKAAWTSIGGHTPGGSAGVALGDIDGDGVPEIVTISTDARVLVLHLDGTLVWASESRPADLTLYGYPLLADLDADGSAEVIAGRAIFRADGTLRGVGAWGRGGAYPIPTALDLDDDGVQEVLVGNAAYTPEGEVKWLNETVPDGWTAVGDFDGDGEGEVVVVGGGVWLLDTDGTLLWGPVAIPTGGGGPPTVADFDGDGAPEVGIAGADAYSVFEADGSVLWSAPTTDHSSSVTGSSVFDFEGDGAAEVVYADELVLWVYDGATGAPVLAEEGHSSWTLFEYPLVADVDADGEAEIVLASNDSINAGWQGVAVIGDASRSWAPTAPVWNQHAWYITNVSDTLGIPPHPTPNWLTGHNSFRAGGVREGPGNPAPDLGLAPLVLCWDCGAEAVVVYAQAWNEGTRDLREDLTVDLLLRAETGAEGLVGRQTIPGGLDAGELSAALRWDVPVEMLGDGVVLVARVDPDDAVPECDEEQNEVEAEAGECG